MMIKVFNTFFCLALGIGLAHVSFAEGEIQFILSVNSADGVSIDGEDAQKGDAINEDNVSEVTFASGASMVVVNSATGIKYSVANAVDLQFLGNALATSTNGIVIGKWVVGGGVKDTKKSTLLALKFDDSTGGASETPAATKAEPEPEAGQPVSVPRVRPASTPSAPAASSAGP